MVSLQEMNDDCPLKSVFVCVCVRGVLLLPDNMRRLTWRSFKFLSPCSALCHSGDGVCCPRSSSYTHVCAFLGHRRYTGRTRLLLHHVAVIVFGARCFLFLLVFLCAEAFYILSWLVPAAAAAGGGGLYAPLPKEEKRGKKRKQCNTGVISALLSPRSGSSEVSGLQR